MNNSQISSDTINDINENDFAVAVDKVEMDFTPAFVHGVLTAYCCQVAQPHGWATALVAELDPMNITQATQLRYFNEVKNMIAAQLADSELSFQLLLNNTAETLHDEVLLTREWASGYWLGIQSAGIDKHIENDELSSEFINDLPQITAMPLPDEVALEAASLSEGYSDAYDDVPDIYDSDTGDDTRADIMQIQEYCRAGAISVFLASWQD